MNVLVLGLGTMGSATVSHLAARGHKVLGLEQFSPLHDRGSSHGQTRVIRQSYFESPAYVPLLLRAYELWRELEQKTGRHLLHLCGGLMMGPPQSSVVGGSRASAVTHNLPHQILDAADIHRRFPPLRPPDGTIALFEQNAGFLLAEDSVKAHQDLARSLGARLQFEETVLGWEARSDGVRIRSNRGIYEADKLVITAGPWAGQILAELRLPLEVERQVLYWIEPSSGIEPFLPEHFPVFIYETAGGLMPYGLPAIRGHPGGVKVSLYHAPNPILCTPATVDRAIQDDEIVTMRKTIVGLIPSLDGKLLDAKTCMYTNTPDQFFVLDTHPAHSQVSIAAGFSGHGFKFSPVIGEITAMLLRQEKVPFDLRLFKLSRLFHTRPA